MKEITLALARRYAQIALEYGCKTGSQLSQKTYELREAGEDIPYLGVRTTNKIWCPSPKKSQRKWMIWLDHHSDFYKEIHSVEGWYNIYVEAFEFGFSILAYNSRHSITNDSDGVKKIDIVKATLAEYTFAFDYTITKTKII